MPTIPTQTALKLGRGAQKRSDAAKEGGEGALGLSQHQVAVCFKDTRFLPLPPDRYAKYRDPQANTCSELSPWQPPPQADQFHFYFPPHPPGSS